MEPNIRAPMIGRGPEFRELDLLYSKAAASAQVQTILVQGEPGSGKTRLAATYLERLALRERRCACVTTTCRLYAQPLAPVRELLVQLLDLSLVEGSAANEDALRERVRSLLGDERVDEFVFFLASFLDMEVQDSPFLKLVEEEPEELVRLSRAVLRRVLETSAVPIVWLIDDVHLIDDDTLGALLYLIRTMTDARVLFLLVGRPGAEAKVDAVLQQVHTLELSPLSTTETANLFLSLTQFAEVPEAVIDRVVEVSSGAPYLVEQLVHAYRSAGAFVVGSDGVTRLDPAKVEQVRLPMSMEEGVQLRLANLSSAERDLLERAACLGPSFWKGSLVALGRIDARVPDLWGGHGSGIRHLEDALGHLVEREYIVQRRDSRIPGDVEYVFRHAMERESLYRGLSSSTAARFHRIIAHWLDTRFASRGEEQLESLAMHFSAAGLRLRAAIFCLDAAERARARFANETAVQNYVRGLEFLGDEDLSRRIEALHGYGDVLQRIGDIEGARTAFREVLELAFRLDLKAKGGVAHNRLGRLARATGHLDEAMRHLGTGAALFEAAADERGLASSTDDIGKVHWLRGDYHRAETFFSRALSMRRELGDTRSIALSLNNLGLVYQDSGRLADARIAFDEALLLRRDIGDRAGIAQTLNNLGTVQQDAGDVEKGIATYAEALEIARTMGDRMRQAVVLTNLGEAHYRSGRPEVAITMLEEAEVLSRSLGDRLLEAEILRGLAKAHALIHEYSAARDFIERSIELFEHSRSKPFLGLAHRTLGEIVAAAGWGGEEYARAQVALRRAIAIFDELGNQLELARSIEALVLVLRKQGASAAELAPWEAKADFIRSGLERSGTPTRPRGDQTAAFPIQKSLKQNPEED